MQKPPITVESTIVRCGEFLTAVMDDDLVMMSLETNNYYGFDSVGRSVWESISTPIRVSELCARLTQEFMVDSDQCREDVLGFLAELQTEGLIRSLP